MRNQISGKLNRKIRCIDGRYREDCSNIKHTACSAEKPIRCPDGRCAAVIILCASFLCPADTPFRCMTNRCVKTFDECQYGYNLHVAKNFVAAIDSSSTVYQINSLDKTGLYLGEIKVDKKLNLVVEGVGMSEVENSRNNYIKGTESVFNNYLAVAMDEIKPVDFIRSTIIRIKGLAKLEVNNPDSIINVHFSFDQPNPLDSTSELSVEVF